MPLAIVVVYSFGVRGTDGGYAPALVLDNYTRLFARADPFITSLEIAIAGTILCLLVGLPLAYFIATRAGRAEDAAAPPAGHPVLDELPDPDLSPG